MSRRWLTFLPLVLGLLFWFTKGKAEHWLASFKRPTPLVSLETARFYSLSAKKFSLGFDNFIADLSWIQLLQGASHEPLKGDGVSWEYANVHLINTLDPKFSKAYWFGASFVSIFRRDELGAKDILKSWTFAQPLLWTSHYMLGFHLFHEMQENEAGAEELLKASTLPRAPSWLVALGIRLLTESGGAFSALQTALGLYDSLTDDEGRYRLGMRIRSLNYNLQKATWKEAAASYRARFAREPASIGELEKLGVNPQSEIANSISRLEIPNDVAPLLRERFSFRYDPETQEMVGIISEADQYLEHLGLHKSGKKI